MQGKTECHLPQEDFSDLGENKRFLYLFLNDHAFIYINLVLFF